MKPILFLLNDRCALKLGGTNHTLMEASDRLGHPVYISDVVHLQASCNAEVYADSIKLPELSRAKHTRAVQAKLSKTKSEQLKVSEFEAVFIRTTPGKDIARSWAHRLAIEVMRISQESGVRVFNDPAGLQKASSKLYTVCLPEEFVPRTLICHTLQSVQTFAAELDGPMVIKPLLGSQGRDVFFFDGFSTLNTRQVVEILGRTGYLVVQEYLPLASKGDIRVLTLDDRIVSPDQPMGILRTPAAGEMRSNISLGGTASAVGLTDRQIVVCSEIARQLKADGIRFSGLDLIGDKVVEVNVFSPSGLQEYDRCLDTDISQSVIERLLGV